MAPSHTPSERRKKSVKKKAKVKELNPKGRKVVKTISRTRVRKR